MAAPIRVEYFTDPYCAWSWALQPILEELMATEEDGIALTFRSLPLVPDLEKSGKSAEEWAQAWERVGRLTGAKIDASLWRKQPPHSTIPAIHAAKAAGSLGRGAEWRFVQALRPKLMREGRSADDPDTLHQAAREAGLDMRAFDEALERDYADSLAEDARRVSELAIKSSPALLLTNRKGDRVLIEGPRDLELFKRAIETLRLEEDLEDAAAQTPRLTTTPLMKETPKEVRKSRET